MQLQSILHPLYSSNFGDIQKLAQLIRCHTSSPSYYIKHPFTNANCLLLSGQGNISSKLYKQNPLQHLPLSSSSKWNLFKLTSPTHMITKSVSSTINMTNKLLGNFLYSYSRESVIIMCVCLDLWLLVQEYVTTTRQIAIRASHIIAWARPSSSPSAISIAS